MLNIHLEPEGAGWLKAHISLGDESWDFLASDLGSNLCEQLVFTAIRLNERNTEQFLAEQIDMYGEPAGLTLYITREEGKVIIRLYYKEDADLASKGTLGDCLKKVESTSSEICEVSYRTLRTLLISYGLEYLSAEWQEFPVGAFIKLHRSLGHEPVLLYSGLDAELRCLSTMLKGRTL